MNANKIVLNDFIEKHPFAAAQTLQTLASEEVASFIETLTLEQSSKLLSLMNAHKAAHCFAFVSPSKSKELMEKADVSLIASILRETETPLRRKLVNSVSSERRAKINRQLEVVPNSIASIMDQALIVSKQMTVEDALHLMKRDNIEQEFYLYVVDLEGAFEGILRLKELFLGDKNDILEDLMITDIQSFLKDVPVSGVLEHPAWLTYQEIPVLDSAGKLLGKVPHRNLLKFKSAPGKISNNEISDTGSAIGELYRIGLSSLLQGGK